MKQITRDHVTYSLDRAHPPVLEIESGETVRFETFDARTGSIRSDNDLLDRPHPLGTNPATGPVAVKDARPGDSLAVKIISIDLAAEGFLAIKKGIGLLGHRAGRSVTRMIPIRDGRVCFSERIRFAVRPMVGVIGTAPAEGGVPTGYPGPQGGNMDNNYVASGATVHLPVAVAGALLGIGDVHASMGDGEITMVGLEICGEVTVRVDLIKSVAVSRPWIETRDVWVTTGDALAPAEALRIAAEEMVELLQRKLEIGFDEAYMLMCARADVQICQICDPGNFPVTARAVFPHAEIAP